VTDKFRALLFEPLKDTYDRLKEITQEFNYKGRWMEATREFTGHCNKIIDDMVQIYTNGIRVLEETQVILREMQIWLNNEMDRLKQGVINGQLTDPSKSSQGIRLYLGILQQINEIDIQFKKIIVERMKFVKYQNQEWVPGYLTVDLLHCIRKIVENELYAAHLFVHESEKEESDNEYHSKYLPEDGPRNSEHYIDYRDSLMNMKTNSEYLSWTDNDGVILYETRIFE
jgi:hypothetical protein